MSKLKRTLLLLTWCIAASTLLFVAVGCTKNNENKPPAFAEESLTINKTEASMLIGDEMLLEADYTLIPNGTLTFMSSNPSVATVDGNGKIVGVSRGEATISVSYGSLTKTCTVSIGLGSFVPGLVFEQIEGESATVALEDQLNFASYVAFNGKNYEDVTLTYESSNQSVATIEDGILTPKSLGETTIVIEGTWRGESGGTLNKSVLVKVVEDVALFVNGEMLDEISLYTTESFEGKTYDKTLPFVATVRENGEISSCTATLLSNTDCVVFENDKITGLREGTAEMQLTHTSKSGTAYEKTVSIHVILPVGVYAPIIEYSAMDGNLPVADIFGAETVITYAKEGATTYQVADNKLLNFTAKETALENREVTLYSETCGYTVTLRTYTKIIKTVADLAVFDLTAANTVVRGQYLLANDIDQTVNGTVKDNVLEHNGFWPARSSSTVKSTAGFAGTLYGNGKSLTVNVAQVGLFGNLLDGATVKDVAIYTNVRTQSATKAPYPSALAYSSTSSGKILFENCYIKVLSATTHKNISPVIFGTSRTVFTFNDVVIDNQFVNTDSSYTGGSVFRDESNRSNSAATYDKYYAGLYVISNVSYISRWGQDVLTTADGTTKVAVRHVLAGNAVAEYDFDSGAYVHEGYASTDSSTKLNSNIIYYKNVLQFSTYAKLLENDTFTQSKFKWAITENGAVTWKK